MKTERQDDAGPYADDDVAGRHPASDEDHMVGGCYVGGRLAGLPWPLQPRRGRQGRRSAAAST